MKINTNKPIIFVIFIGMLLEYGMTLILSFIVYWAYLTTGNLLCVTINSFHEAVIEVFIALPIVLIIGTYTTIKILKELLR